MAAYEEGERMKTKASTAGLLVLWLACGVVQAAARCRAIPFVPPKAGGSAVTTNRLEGQVVTPVATLTGQMAEVSDLCMALFDPRTGRRIAVGRTMNNGDFVFDHARTGRYVVVLAGSRAPKWRMPVLVELSEATSRSQPLLGLFLTLKLSDGRRFADRESGTSE